MDERLARLLVSVEAHYRSIDHEERNERYESHWWDHVSRVFRNAALIAKEERVAGDLEILLAAALCHDIHVESSGQDDARKSSLECKRLMVASGFGEGEANLGASLVLSTDRDVKDPETLLEKILYTADKLDLFGVDGTVRLVVQEARRGITVRDELAEQIASRQDEWLTFMRSLRVGSQLVAERADWAKLTLDALRPVEPDIDP